MSSLFPAAIAAVTSFDFHSHAVRVVMRDGEPWFVAADVANVLGYRNAPDAARSLPDHQKGTQIVRTPGGDQSMTIISEPGLYRLVLRSRKPEAEAFTDWVTGEVLPSIRKTGSYSTAPAKAQLDDQTLYAIGVLMIHFRALHEWATVNKVPQAMAWLGSPLGGELRDRLLDGMYGGVKNIERTLGAELERVMPKFNPAATRLQPS